MKKTKIIATIGPSSSNEKTLKSMILAGVNVVRINLSHTGLEELERLINLTKTVRKELAKEVSIMVDTRGPEIRTGAFEDSVALKKGQNFTFFKKDVVGNQDGCTIKQKSVFNDVQKGFKFSACNGLIKFKCLEKTQNDDLICKVLSSGIISSNKSMSFPNVKLSEDYLNDHDKTCIEYSVKNGVDYVACSFVSEKSDLIQIAEIVKKFDASTKLISKIENKLGINNLNEILENCDGVMVARGDLGIEIPQEKVPSIQKNMIQKCKETGKIVIIATEMLESMINSIRPTRAETSDVANAIYDGASAIMLSGETAVGKFPVEVVETMSKIALEAEKSINYQSRFEKSNFKANSIQDVMSMACVQSSFLLKGVKAIVVYTDSGHTAHFISRFRPNVPIIALTPSEQTFNQLALEWGVMPVLIKGIGRADDLIDISNAVVKQYKIAKEEDIILIGSGSRKPTKTDMMKFHIVV